MNKYLARCSRTYFGDFEFEAENIEDALEQANDITPEEEDLSDTNFDDRWEIIRDLGNC